MYKLKVPKAFNLQCSEKGCSQHADIYRLPGLGKEAATQIKILCPDHAAEQGYCYVCGVFCPGTETFNFPVPNRIKVLCDKCNETLSSKL